MARPTKAEAEAKANRKVWAVRAYPEGELLDLRKLTKAEMESHGILYAQTPLFAYIEFLNTLKPLTDFIPVSIEAEGALWTLASIEPILRASGVLLRLTGDNKYIPAMFLGRIDEHLS